MKKKLINSTLCFLAIIFALYATPASASVKHLSIGDVEIVIEPPLGMCFLDQGSSSTIEMYNDLMKRLSDTSQKQVLAIFAPCISIAAAAGDIASNKILENFGYISWLYPSMEYRYNEGRKSFISDLQKKFKKANRGGLKDLDNSVATLLRETKTVDEKLIEDVSIMAYTTIRDFPLEIKVKISMANFESAEQSYAMLNDFINYQIELNE